MKRFALNGKDRLIGLKLDDNKATFSAYEQFYYKGEAVSTDLIEVEALEMRTVDYLAWKKPSISRKATVEIYDNMTKVRVSGVQPPHLEGKKRNTVGIDFAGKKRKRFVDEINKWRIPQDAKKFMVTLTYPDVFPLDWRIWKEHLEQFRAEMLKLYPDLQGFWRLELIDRKSGVNRGLIAPHFHMILATFTGITNRQFRDRCKEIWAKIAHGQDKYQGKMAVRVDKIHTARHALNYAAKYCTKWSAAPITSDGEIMNQSHIAGTVGRQWGKIGKPDCSPSAIYTVDRKSAAILFDLCCEMKFQAGDAWKGLFKQDQNGSYTVYGIGDNPKMHERYNRPSLFPAFEMLRRAVKRAGNVASVRMERPDWNAPLTDEMCL